MRYASPNGVLNMLLGSTNRIFDLSVGGFVICLKLLADVVYSNLVR